MNIFSLVDTRAARAKPDPQHLSKKVREQAWEQSKRKYVKTSGVYRGFLPARGGAEGRKASSPPAVKIKEGRVSRPSLLVRPSASCARVWSEKKATQMGQASASCMGDTRMRRRVSLEPKEYYIVEVEYFF